MEKAAEPDVTTQYHEGLANLSEFGMNRQIVTGFIVNFPVIGTHQVCEGLAFLLTLLPSSWPWQPRSARYDRYADDLQSQPHKAVLRFKQVVNNDFPAA